MQWQFRSTDMDQLRESRSAPLVRDFQFSNSSIDNSTLLLNMQDWPYLSVWPDIYSTATTSTGSYAVLKHLKVGPFEMQHVD